MVRAALAIGQDSGLRLGEICNLRLQDVDLDSMRLFVRLPNKTDTERWAFFTDRAARYIAEWLNNSEPTCDHDHLLHNRYGNPPRQALMHDTFCRVFCKVHGGKGIHDEGMEKWSTHRLRHTMASNLASGGASVSTIMQAGGWKSPSAMLNYTQPDPELARRGYFEAMAKADAREKDQPSREVISPEAFLSDYGEGPPK